MTFKIYDVSINGEALWTEVHSGVSNTVPVENGLFQVMLGSLTPIPDSVWDSGTLYLGVQVASDPEMAPRELIGSVPRAIQADMALTVPDGAITNLHQVTFGPDADYLTTMATVYENIPGYEITMETTGDL